MAVFGAPIARDDHADRALLAAKAMHRGQAVVNTRWQEHGLPPWGIGIGLTTGEVAAALLGSEERLEYTLVGDTVNLAQRLQQLAEPGETVLSDATHAMLTVACDAERLEPALVKGRHTPVVSFRVPVDGGFG